MRKIAHGESPLGGEIRRKLGMENHRFSSNSLYCLDLKGERHVGVNHSNSILKTKIFSKQSNFKFYQ